MQDFNNFKGKSETNQKANGSVNSGGLSPEVMKMLTSITSKYNGASEKDLWKAIYAEAEKGYKNGTLKASDLDAFASTVAPMLDGKKRAKLYEIVNKLKNSVK